MDSISLRPILEIYFALEKFALDFFTFFTSDLNTFFGINLGAFGEVSCIDFFFGAGIIVFLSFVLIDSFIPL